MSSFSMPMGSATGRSGSTHQPDSASVPDCNPRANRGRLARFTSGGMALALVAGMLSAFASLVAVTVAPQVAGASTTPTAVSWSATPNCNSYETATPPVGTVSATLTMSGGGGGGGATNSSSGGTGAAPGVGSAAPRSTLTHPLGPSR